METATDKLFRVAIYNILFVGIYFSLEVILKGHSIYCIMLYKTQATEAKRCEIPHHYLECVKIKLVKLQFSKASAQNN